MEANCIECGFSFHKSHLTNFVCAECVDDGVLTKTDKRDRVLRWVNRILNAAHNMAENNKNYLVRNAIEYITIHIDGYAEPGCTSQHDIIATGNWNDIYKYENGERTFVSDIPSRVGKLLEKIGVEIEWEDEWAECSNCGKLVRTSPNTYGWQPSFKLMDCELLCIDCIEDDVEGYLLSLEGNSDTANTISSINPEDYGYIKYSDDNYETGCHYGQNDKPAKIAKELEKLEVSRYLFNVESTGQFETKWNVYVHNDEVDLLE